ncbi:unnamed protein product, partial [Lampetra fluviatilis]
TNSRRAAQRGQLRVLLRVYLAWHGRDARHRYVWLRRALLVALGRGARTRAGRHALGHAEALATLHHSTQALVQHQSSCSESLAAQACLVMRRAQPRLRLPLASLRCPLHYPLHYPLPTPGVVQQQQQQGQQQKQGDRAHADYVDSSDSESDVEEQRDAPHHHDEPPHHHDEPPHHQHHHEGEEGGSEWLGGSHRYPDLNVYAKFCPDITHDFAEYVRDAADDDDDEGLDDDDDDGEALKPETSEWPVGGQAACRHEQAARLTRAVASPAPGHRGATAPTAFPDTHGHSPAPGSTCQLARRDHVQRDYVLDDIARFVHPETLLNRVVFDIESTTPPSAQKAGETGPSPLTFYSAFESGNLRKVIQVRSYEYDLLLNSDPNTDRHHQWFYFEVGNMAAGTGYRLNIINCEKSSSQFNHGMQPVLYSVREALEGRPHWVRAGTDVCYYKNNYRRPSRVTGGVRGQSFFSLSLSLSFPHGGDVCYLAHHYPYTFTSLMVDLDTMLSACDRSSVFVQRDVLCATAGGNSCPLLTITAAPTSHRDLQSLRRRPCVFLSARVHPGESNSSWVMRGSLRFLLGASVEAAALRRHFVFRLLPMLNPDGVASGAHRCALSGEDLNRQWRSPCPRRSPTVYHSRGLLHYLASVGHTPVVFCDFHGHSSKKNVFLYGCSLRETLCYSELLGNRRVSEDSGYRTLSRLLASCAPMFSERSSRFLVERSRDATARVVVWRELGVRRSYTMETSFCGCDHGPYK